MDANIFPSLKILMTDCWHQKHMNVPHQYTFCSTANIRNWKHCNSLIQLVLFVQACGLVKDYCTSIRQQVHVIFSTALIKWIYLSTWYQTTVV